MIVVGGYRAAAGGGGGGGGTVTATYRSNKIIHDSYGSSVATFNSMAIGTASATRIVAVLFGLDANGDGDNVTAVTIGGVSATRQAHGTRFSRILDCWTAVVPTGTTATITVTEDSNQSNWHGGIIVYSIDGASSATAANSIAVASGGDPYVNGSWAIAAGSASIGVVSFCQATPDPPTWGNLTHDISTTHSDGWNWRAASASNQSAGSPSLSSSGIDTGGNIYLFLTWAP